MKWYITVAAVLEYQAICGRPERRDGPEFDRAAKELEQLCESAERKKTGLWQAKTKLGGRTERIELHVSTRKRPEGDLPQLVRVRLRSRGRRKKPSSPEVVRRPISLPSDWLTALAAQAEADGMSFSQWLCDCGRANLPESVAETLSEWHRLGPRRKAD